MTTSLSARQRHRRLRRNFNRNRNRSNNRNFNSNRNCLRGLGWLVLARQWLGRYALLRALALSSEALTPYLKITMG